MKFSLKNRAVVYETMGQFFFWLLWPLIWLYAPLSVRARLLIVCGDEILLVRPHFGSGKWQLPGGGIHKHESADKAAIREVFEETGVVLPNGGLNLLCRRKVFSESGLWLRYTIYFVTLNSRPPTKPNSREVAAASWVKAANVNTANHVRWALQQYAAVAASHETQV